MKRLCKDVDISDINLIRRSVYCCFDKKYKRNDTMEFLSNVSGIDKNKIKYIYKKNGKYSLYPFVELVVKELQSEIISKNISLIEMWYKEKKDVSSGKIRRIGIQNIKQQLYDYIAVEGLQPLLKRIGEYQYASIPGRGTTKGKYVISRWLRNKSLKYYVKLDVRKCFESIDHGKIMDFLSKHIKNNDLLWLINELLNTFEKGLSIGSYLSQYLCNLYMSELYHYIKEDLRKIKRGKSIGLTKKCLIFMDDILLIGTRKRDMEKAVKLIVKKANEMSLTIKDNYQIRKIKENECIDMMGYKIYTTHTEIRKRIFLRIRKAFKKARKMKNITIDLARKCISYFGYLKHTDSKRIRRKWKVKNILRKCKEVVRNESKISITAGTC